VTSKVTTIKVTPRNFDADRFALTVASAIELISGVEVRGHAHYNIESDSYDVALEWDEPEGQSHRVTW
jgi:hypothetical protein